VISPGKLNEKQKSSMKTPPSEAWDFDYRGPSDYRKVAHVIQKDFPELYRLEHPWLRKFLVADKRHQLFGVTEIWLAIFALLVLLCFYLSSTQTFN
jgi:hypothetical protein